MERKTWKNSLLMPLKDKQRTMKLEYLLSNNYSIAVLVILIDSVLLFGTCYLLHLFRHIPKILLGKAESGEIFAWNYFLPELSWLTSKNMPLIMVIIGILDFILIFKIKVSWSEDYFNVGQKGVSRFVSEEEMVREYKAIDPLETRYPGDPGILVSRIGSTFYIDDMVTNNLILGITRSGKGETLVKSSLEIYSRAEHQPSLIINDPKLEHYKVFSPILEGRGYGVYLLNASNPKLSMGFNLVAVAVQFYKKKDYDMAEQVVNSLAYSYFDVEKAKGDMMYFVSAAAALYTAMILASMQDAIAADEQENQLRYEKWLLLEEEEKKKHPFRYRHNNEKTINLYSMIINFGQLVTKPVNKSGTRTMLDVFFEKRPVNDRARMKYIGVQVAPDRTKSGVFSEMLRELDIFTLQNVGRMTAESSLDFAEIGFGEKPVAVFLATPSYDASLYKLPTIFIRQMYYVLGKICDDHKGRCDRQVKVILDEAGNMPNIELMKVMTTMGLGQNISFDIYIHNYEQLDDVYGAEVAKTIKGNCGNHFFLQTNSGDTAKAFSEMLGSKSIIDVQRSGEKLSVHKYYSENIQDRPLLNMNELMELQEGEIVIVRRSKRKDLKGKKIKPRPIFNSIENGRFFQYAYEYMPRDKYKNPNEVNFLDINKESREHIHLEDRIWDIQKSFDLMERREKRVKTLKDTPQYAELRRVIEQIFGEHAEEAYGITPEMTAAEFTDFVNRQDISEVEKEVLFNIVYPKGVP